MENHYLLLSRLGMSNYEASLYLALAKNGSQTVTHAAAAAHIPRTKAYTSLLSLEQKGYIVSRKVTPLHYEISDPGRIAREIDNMKDAALHLKKTIESQRNEHLFSIIQGKKAIIDKIAFENKRAEKEVFSCNKLSRIVHENMETLRDSVKRGVDVRFITLQSQAHTKNIALFAEAGSRIRYFDEKQFGPLLPRISIFDGKRARLTIGEPEVSRDEDYITLFTESESFSLMLRSHFLSMWEKGQKYK